MIFPTKISNAEKNTPWDSISFGFSVSLFETNCYLINLLRECFYFFSIEFYHKHVVSTPLNTFQKRKSRGAMEKNVLNTVLQNSQVNTSLFPGNREERVDFIYYYVIRSFLSSFD